MRRVVAVFLLLAAGSAFAGKIKLRDLLDPADENFRLRHYTWEAWKNVSKDEKLRARGVDPSEWTEPVPWPETEEEKKKREAREKRIKDQLGPNHHPQDRWPGYKYDERLKAKAAAFDELIGAGSAPVLAGLVKKLDGLDKALAKYDKSLGDIRKKYDQVSEQHAKASSVYAENYKKKHGRWPDVVQLPRNLIQERNRWSRRLQEALALRESEVQFHEWLVKRLARLIADLSDEERAKPVAALVKGMGDRDWQTRVRCGAILGALTDARSTAAFREALENEKDALVLSDLIRIRAKRGGKGLMELLEARLEDPQWPVRAAVIRALGEMPPRKKIVDLLVARLAQEDGRLRDDVTRVLKRLTGQNFLAEPDPWRIWWEKNRATWTPPAPGVPKDGEAGVVKKGGGLYFYGIRTSSTRIVFCVDVSGSMEFPLDGRGGKKAPRIEAAKRELNQALAALPEEAEFNVVVYNAKVRVWKKRLQPATLANKQAARKFVDRLEPAGATNIFDALTTSMEVAADAKKKDDSPQADTIFFLSDGQPTDGEIVDPHQILEEVTRRNATLGLVIHTVGVSKEQNRGLMVNLAKRNGGQYVGHK